MVRDQLPRDFDLNGTSVLFIVPMPKSWSKKKKAEMDGQPHTQTPDTSNMLKALEDAHQTDDSGIWWYTGMMKLWGKEGRIIISYSKRGPKPPCE
jgi:Holliday junction resolvase RusA-like endonuclease